MLLPVDDDGVGGRLVAIPAAFLVTTPTGRERKNNGSHTGTEVSIAANVASTKTAGTISFQI